MTALHASKHSIPIPLNRCSIRTELVLKSRVFDQLMTNRHPRRQRTFKANRHNTEIHTHVHRLELNERGSALRHHADKPAGSESFSKHRNLFAPLNQFHAAEGRDHAPDQSTSVGRLLQRHPSIHREHPAPDGDCRLMRSIGIKNEQVSAMFQSRICP